VSRHRRLQRLVQFAFFDPEDGIADAPVTPTSHLSRESAYLKCDTNSWDVNNVESQFHRTSYDFFFAAFSFASSWALTTGTLLANSSRRPIIVSISSMSRLFRRAFLSINFSFSLYAVSMISISWSRGDMNFAILAHLLFFIASWAAIFCEAISDE
jgi:hypothetical protein